MISPSRLGRQAPIVVCVSGSVVEALVPRQTRVKVAAPKLPFRLVRFSHELELGDALAELIAGRLVAHGARRAPVTLALGSDVVRSTTVEIPRLALRDTDAVIGRRAAALLDGLPETTLHSGLALDGEDASMRRWLVHACDRRSLTAFQTAMRRLGFPVRIAVPMRTAPFLSETLARATPSPQPAPEDADGDAPEAAAGATLVAVFERESCHVGLISERRLVQLTELPGSADAHQKDEPTARAFIQELRGIDAFWRRASRGEQVSAVLLAGIEAAAVKRMRPSIHAALGAVAVDGLTLEGHGGEAAARAGVVGGLEGLDGPTDLAPLDDASERARTAVLASLQSPRIAAVDLAAELRPRARTLTAVAGSSLVICSALAITVRTDLESRARSLETSNQVVAARGPGLGELRELEIDARRAEAELMESIREIRDLSALGLDIESLGEGVFDALGRDASLLSMSATGMAPGQSGGGILRVRGVVPDVPGETSRTLSAIDSRLRRVPGVADAEIDMPSLDDRQGGGAALGFSARVTLEDRRAGARSEGPEAAR